LNVPKTERLIAMMEKDFVDCRLLVAPIAGSIVKT
jgi:hypothetical protein